MNSSTSCIDAPPAAAVTFSEDEVVTLFLNMIAFKGDWEAHLDFLDGLNEDIEWRSTQIPLVMEMERRDSELGIQETIA